MKILEHARQCVISRCFTSAIFGKKIVNYGSSRPHSLTQLDLTDIGNKLQYKSRIGSIFSTTLSTVNHRHYVISPYGNARWQPWYLAQQYVIIVKLMLSSVFWCSYKSIGLTKLFLDLIRYSEFCSSLF